MVYGRLENIMLQKVATVLCSSFMLTICTYNALEMCNYPLILGHYAQ